jgi:hypothetical protein
MLTAYSARWARRTTPRAARALRRCPRPRLDGPAAARWRGFESGAGTEPARHGFAANEGSAAVKRRFEARRARRASPLTAAPLRAERTAAARRGRPGGHGRGRQTPGTAITAPVPPINRIGQT